MMTVVIIILLLLLSDIINICNIKILKLQKQSIFPRSYTLVVINDRVVQYIVEVIMLMMMVRQVVVAVIVMCNCHHSFSHLFMHTQRKAETKINR